MEDDFGRLMELQKNDQFHDNLDEQRMEKENQWTTAVQETTKKVTERIRRYMEARAEYSASVTSYWSSKSIASGRKRGELTNRRKRKNEKKKS